MKRQNYNSTSLIVGVTGGIGCGKSQVTKIIESLHMPVYIADKNAKYIMTHSEDVREKICQILGNESYLSDGKINKHFIRKKIFYDNTLREKLNNIVHPKVYDDFNVWVYDHLNKGHRIMFIESALLFQGELYKKCQWILGIIAPLDLRIKWITKRDSIKKETILKIISTQPKDWYIKKYSNRIILNNDTLEYLTKQVYSRVKEIQQTIYE